MPRKKKLPLPAFATREEAADFWDTHSPLDYEGTEILDEPLRVKRPLVHTLQVRFDVEDLDALMEEGQRIGVPSSTLVRVWVKEKLAEMRARQKSAS
ncbi:MAG: hypothetical protein EPO21_13215 [Chloroflexota bacterium]|nr:MAG: hypothetical protein EPO21_13215 [Chloroflexota bacterium]